jgi:DNA-binding response OmpR family regulator
LDTFGGKSDVIYLFENYSLDTGRRELCAGSELVPIEPLVFDLLQFLLSNRERVVSKDDLFAEVWNGRIVSESTLSSRITAARHAIGDSGDSQRLIRTVARKGFRFVGVVREETNPKPNAQPGNTTAAEQVAPKATKILVVDDHALVREALRGVLKELKGPTAIIVEASDSRQAKRQIDQNPDLDLILLDLGLPDRDGFEILADLAERSTTISVVVLSASNDRERVTRALDLGAVGFIPKSASREIMISAFNLIFSGGIYIPPDILGRRQ